MRTLLALALVASPAFADGNTSKADAKTKVSIYAPITIVSTQDLDFGAIVMNDFSGGSVTLDPSAAPDYQNCARLTGSKARGHQLAWFHVRKDANLTYTRTATAHTVADCTFSPVLFGTVYGCGWNGMVGGVDFTDKAGTTKEHFFVGGKLTIPADTFGEKTGTVEVTVDYN